LRDIETGTCLGRGSRRARLASETPEWTKLSSLDRNRRTTVIARAEQELGGRGRSRSDLVRGRRRRVLIDAYALRESGSPLIGACHSDRGFASGFLPTPPRDGEVALGLWLAHLLPQRTSSPSVLACLAHQKKRAALGGPLFRIDGPKAARQPGPIPGLVPDR
jgi:hypothetical protein